LLQPCPFHLSKLQTLPFSPGKDWGWGIKGFPHCDLEPPILLLISLANRSKVLLCDALRQSLGGRQDGLFFLNNVAFAGHEIRQHAVSTIVEN